MGGKYITHFEATIPSFHGLTLIFFGLKQCAHLSLNVVYFSITFSQLFFTVWVTGTRPGNASDRYRNLADAIKLRCVTMIMWKNNHAICDVINFSTRLCHSNLYWITGLVMFVSQRHSTGDLRKFHALKRAACSWETAPQSAPISVVLLIFDLSQRFK